MRGYDRSEAATAYYHVIVDCTRGRLGDLFDTFGR